MPSVNLTILLEGEDLATIQAIVDAMSISGERTRIPVKVIGDIPEGKPAMYVGYNAGLDEIEVTLADNTVGVAIGITPIDYTNGDSGFLISNGVIPNIDTSAFNDGDILYVNTGVLTNIQPTVGYQQPIAYVLKSNANVGELMVDVGYPKQDASDVRFSGSQSVEDELILKAYLASPSFTGTPTAPTPAVDNNSTFIATTGFVIAQLAEEAGTTLAELVGGVVPASQLPAYVDDVLEYANFASLPVSGEAGKIYVTLDNNLTYRWSGSAYVEISASLALGTTSATAFRGDWGLIAYNHSQATHAPTDADNTANNETAHADVVVDGDFASEGVMYRGATTGLYSLKVIGVDIQAYDVDTAKLDIAQTFTNAQRTQINTGATNAIAFNPDNNFSFTATATTISVTSQTVGQGGNIRILSSNLITGWGTEFDWGIGGAPTDLVGTEIFSYFVWDASGVDSITIRRL